MSRLRRLRWIIEKGYHPNANLLSRFRVLLCVLRGHETEICGRCGRGVDLVWSVPDELWLAHNGTGRDDGVLCASCFDTLANRNGVLLLWEARAGVWPTCSGDPCPEMEVMVRQSEWLDEQYAELLALRKRLADERVAS